MLTPRPRLRGRPRGRPIHSADRYSRSVGRRESRWSEPSCRRSSPLGQSTRLGVSLDDLVQIAGGGTFYRSQRLLDRLRDAEEREPSFEERGYRDLARGVERTGIRTALLTGAAGP